MARVTNLVTNLGDAWVTIATATLVLGCFMASSRRVALHWLAAVAACGAATAAGKVALYAYGAPLQPFALLSPSGHVAASVLVYGVMPMAAGRPRRSWIALAIVIVSLIAASRIYLQAHTGPDVVVGAGIGGACLGWFLLRGPARLDAVRTTLRAMTPAAVMLCALGAASGWRLQLDRFLRDVAAYLGS